MTEHVNIIEQAKKHPLPVIGLAAGVGFLVYKARQSSANAASTIPVLGAPASDGSTVAGGYPSTPATTFPDLTALTDQLTTAFSTVQGEISSLASGGIGSQLSQIPGYTAGEQQYLAGYTPATALQSSAVSAAQSAGQTLSANCNKVTSCKGFFSCINPFRQIPALIGCAGQAVLTVGTGVAATVLPSVQTATNALANYAPSLLGAGLGIPGLPKAPAATTSPAVGSLYNPYATAPIAPITAPKPVTPAAPTPVAPAPTIYPVVFA